jgi:hypothetical protein
VSFFIISQYSYRGRWSDFGTEIIAQSANRPE